MIASPPALSVDRPDVDTESLLDPASMQGSPALHASTSALSHASWSRYQGDPNPPPLDDAATMAKPLTAKTKRCYVSAWHYLDVNLHQQLYQKVQQQLDWIGLVGELREKVALRTDRLALRHARLVELRTLQLRNSEVRSAVR